MRRYEACIDFQNVHRLSFGRQGRALCYGLAGLYVHFGPDDLVRSVEPYNVQWEVHVGHPKRPVVLMAKDE